MRESKYCSGCGCYLPELLDICPSCGAKEKSDTLESIKLGDGLPPLNPFGNLHPAEIPIRISNPKYKRIVSAPYDVMDVVPLIVHDYRLERDIFNIQNTLYFIQAAFMVDKGVPCFASAIEATDFGVNIPDFRHKYNYLPLYTFELYLPAAEYEVSKAKIWQEDCDRIDDLFDVMADDYRRLRRNGVNYGQVIRNQDPWKKAMLREDRIITNESLKEFFSPD